MIIGDYIEDFNGFLKLLLIRGKGYCIMEQKIDNIYRSYKDDDNIDNVLFDIYEMILAKLDCESFVEIY
jgi:hypothetical protein